MDTRSELVRLAQAGDLAAIHTLLDQNHAAVYRMALTILNDSAEAARAARDSEVALVDDLAHYPGSAAHTAWIYQITLQVCRRRLRWLRWVQHLPRGLRARLNLPEPPSRPQKGWLVDVARLPDDLRLPLVLRYMHDLLPAEIAQVLNWSDGVVQKRLHEARARLRRPPVSNSAGPEADLSHSQAEKYMEEAADFHITDADAELLSRHLRQCPHCQEAALRLKAFEDELRAAFHLRWDGDPVPEPGTAAALDHRRRQMTRRHSLSLAGAMLATVFLVGMILLMPAMLPDRPLMQPPSPPPPSATPSPTAGATEPPFPSSRRNTRPTLSSFPSDGLSTPIPFSRIDLLRQVYSGKMVFSAFQGANDQVFSYIPGERDARQISFGTAEKTSPVWSPDGTWIAFLSQPQGQRTNLIMVMKEDGTELHTVTPPVFPGVLLDTTEPNGAAQSALYGPPHWSADSRSLVSDVWVSSTSHFVAVFQALTQNGAMLTLPVANLDRSFLSWSPDGSTIAYLDKNGRELWFWEPALPLQVGVNPRPFNSEGAWDIFFGMAWSPDSYSLALITGEREQDVVQTELRIVRKYGFEVRVIPISTGTLTGAPLRSCNLTWSSDGIYLAFTPVFTNSDLTSGRVMLARAEGQSVLPPVAMMSREVNGLTWSPDGRWLAFSSGTEIWAVSLDAYEKDEASLVRLARLPAISLSWQPKPTGIYQ